MLPLLQILTFCSQQEKARTPLCPPPVLWARLWEPPREQGATLGGGSPWQAWVWAVARGRREKMRGLGVVAAGSGCSCLGIQTEGSDSALS